MVLQLTLLLTQLVQGHLSPQFRKRQSSLQVACIDSIPISSSNCDLHDKCENVIMRQKQAPWRVLLEEWRPLFVALPTGALCSGWGPSRMQVSGSTRRCYFLKLLYSKGTQQSALPREQLGFPANFHWILWLCTLCRNQYLRYHDPPHFAFS